jgi:hypothetical protein
VRARESQRKKAKIYSNNADEYFARESFEWRREKKLFNIKEFLPLRAVYTRLILQHFSLTPTLILVINARVPLRRVPRFMTNSCGAEHTTSG